MERYRKYIDLALLLLAAALWFLLRHFLTQVWDLFRLPLVTSLPISLPSLIALLVAVGGFFFARTNAKVFGFLGEVAGELAKVAWPTLQETMASTGVIIVMVGIASLIMFGFDALWGTLTRSLLTL
ncbi:MAG TPA: preprotein translocase subunit SecE [Deltaproteobacteria bacterium]|nr:preprotein translocase subunit SecE [Deltaproteobacteria bacterium]